MIALIAFLTTGTAFLWPQPSSARIVLTCVLRDETRLSVDVKGTWAAREQLGRIRLVYSYVTSETGDWRVSRVKCFQIHRDTEIKMFSRPDECFMTSQVC